MAKWRRHVHLTQKQVVDRLQALDDPLLPATEASLSRIENGKQPYNQRVLEALADIYSIDFPVEPADLIGRDPTKEGRIYDLMARLGPRELDEAEAVIEALARVADKRASHGGNAG